jgi:hypothetical protein
MEWLVFKNRYKLGFLCQLAKAEGFILRMEVRQLTDPPDAAGPDLYLSLFSMGFIIPINKAIA